MDVKYDKIMEVFNITNLFLVPVLGIGRSRLAEMGFLNAFFKEEVCNLFHENCVYILCKPLNSLLFEELIENERDFNPNFVEEVDLGEGLVLLVYAVPSVLLKDIPILMSGKYSKLSEEFMSRIPHPPIVNGKKSESVQYQIHTRHPDLVSYFEDLFGYKFDKTDEVWSLPIMEKETLTKEKLKEYEISNS